MLGNRRLPMKALLTTSVWIAGQLAELNFTKACNTWINERNMIH